jgi:hypothetical protein
LWASEAFTPYLDGLIFVIAPQVDYFLGPLTLPEFLAHRLGNVAIPRLTELEQLRKTWPTTTAMA